MIDRWSGKQWSGEVPAGHRGQLTGRQRYDMSNPAKQIVLGAALLVGKARRKAKRSRKCRFSSRFLAPPPQEVERDEPRAEKRQ